MTCVDRDGEPERIPQSWADNGRREIATAGQREAYAVRAAPVVVERSPSYRVPGNGTYPADYSAERLLEILSVTPDVLRAHEARVPAERVDGSLRPTDRFAAVRAVEADALAPINNENARCAHRRDLTALYGTDVIKAPHEDPATEAGSAFETGAELRADGGDQQ